MSNLTVLSNTSTTEITLMSTRVLKNRLVKLGTESQQIALSLAYYTMVDGNTQPLQGSKQNITTLLSPLYRQFICAKWNKAKGQWEYNKKKSQALLKKLGLEFKNTTFPDFKIAIENSEQLRLAKEADKQAQEEALTPHELEQKEKDRVLKYLVKTGLTELQLRSLVAQVESERSKADQKSIQLASAGK